MPKRRSRAGFSWKQEYGGVPAWGIAAALGLLGVLVAVPAVVNATTPEAAPYVRPSDAFTDASANPAPDAAKAVFIGDSYTAGAGGEGGFVPIVCSERGWECTNLGVGGTSYIGDGTAAQTAEEAQIACGADYCPSYREMITEAAAAAPKVVIVNGGRNMWWADEATITAAVDSFFTELRSALPDAQIIATSPVWDDDAAPEIMPSIRAAVQAGVEAVGGTYVDIGEPLAGRADLIADGVHPNQAGYDLIASSILAALPQE